MIVSQPQTAAARRPRPLPLGVRRPEPAGAGGNGAAGAVSRAPASSCSPRPRSSTGCERLHKTPANARLLPPPPPREPRRLAELTSELIAGAKRRALADQVARRDAPLHLHRAQQPGQARAARRDPDQPLRRQARLRPGPARPAAPGRGRRARAPGVRAAADQRTTPRALGPEPLPYTDTFITDWVFAFVQLVRDNATDNQGQTVDLEQNLRIGRLIQGLRGAAAARPWLTQVRLTIEEDTGAPPGHARLRLRGPRSRRPMPASGCAGSTPSPSIWARRAGRTARRCSSPTRSSTRPAARSSQGRPGGGRPHGGRRPDRARAAGARPQPAGATGPTSRPRRAPPISPSRWPTRARADRRRPLAGRAAVPSRRPSRQPPPIATPEPPRRRAADRCRPSRAAPSRPAPAPQPTPAARARRPQRWLPLALGLLALLLIVGGAWQFGLLPWPAAEEDRAPARRNPSPEPPEPSPSRRSPARPTPPEPARDWRAELLARGQRRRPAASSSSSSARARPRPATSRPRCSPSRRR